MSSVVEARLKSALRRYRCGATLALMAALLGAAAWTVSKAAPSGVYEIKTETDMPNLKESLRYANTQTRRCLSNEAVSGFFPILKYHSFDGCYFEHGDRLGDTIYYPLVCNGSSGTTGAALL